MDLNLRHVRAFVSVAHLRSFTRAAALLNLSQPALTVQIRRLEEALAVRLLDRNSRSVEPTRVGRELLPVFQRVLRELDSVVIDTRDLAARRHGIVRIAALPSVAAGVLPDAIAAFRAAHPRMGFVVKDAIAERVLALVRREEVDLGVTGGEVRDPDVTVLARAADALHVVYPAGHPIGEAGTVTLEALAEYPLVLMDAETSVRAVVDAAFVAAGRLPVTACEATYMMTAVGMVRAGLGLTILPGSAREIRAEPELRARPIAEASFSRPVCLIAKAGRTLPAAAEDFLGELVPALAAEFSGVG
ncbi:DNA-binding transcriptional regulator, LysR family [Methylobacterium sp. 174MFSha1.1]|uniref:LysR family transcriptional regulator n=1 Tax=Methylobacterium sp. 174MFSha1.1 TaxID=1502749 RepID=UPI0008E8CD62|nr:LysR family transcriptional regulator [Methylobacterium sp. 174MFSha1.1]SFV08239.1 DNA-binding transcriptional regulator, LysR family [Methylobacterium sp. 174MFSha1.1]